MDQNTLIFSGAFLWSLFKAPGVGATSPFKLASKAGGPRKPLPPSGTSPKNRGGDAAVAIFSFPLRNACGTGTLAGAPEPN